MRVSFFAPPLDKTDELGWKTMKLLIGSINELKGKYTHTLTKALASQ